jgi:membrane-associated protein
VLLNAHSLLTSFGVLGVLVIVFAETGLLIGFFLPGDTLIFLAGVAASSAAERVVGVHLPFWALIIGLPVAATAGAQVGYYLGATGGRRLFASPNSKVFRTEYLERAEHYFDRFGPARAVVLARFVPVVRTFLNPVAGMLHMPARRFFVWNVVGAVLWTWGLLFAGFWLGAKLPSGIDKFVLPVVAVIVLLSLIGVVREILRARRMGVNALTEQPIDASDQPHASNEL